MKLGFKKMHPNAKLPEYAHVGDAGMDVFSVERATLTVGEPTLVKTGLVAEIPDGYELQVRPRSGLALKQGITVWNSPGTIDSNYRGEIGVILLWTRRMDLEGRNWIEIPSGTKIAQLVLAPVTKAEVHEVQEVSQTDRGEGGFGSTGL